MWKGNDESSNSFEDAWATMNDSAKAAVAALAARDSDLLLEPNTASPPAFPVLPVGFEVFIDEGSSPCARHD